MTWLVAVLATSWLQTHVLTCDEHLLDITASSALLPSGLFHSWQGAYALIWQRSRGIPRQRARQAGVPVDAVDGAGVDGLLQVPINVHALVHSPRAAVFVPLHVEGLGADRGAVGASDAGDLVHKHLFGRTGGWSILAK